MNWNREGVVYVHGEQGGEISLIRSQGAYRGTISTKHLNLREYYETLIIRVCQLHYFESSAPSYSAMHPLRSPFCPCCVCAHVLNGLLASQTRANRPEKIGQRPVWLSANRSADTSTGDKQPNRPLSGRFPFQYRDVRDLMRAQECEKINIVTVLTRISTRKKKKTDARLLLV